VFLLRRCATAEDAADCLAETYRIAWEKRNRIPAGSQARAWLFGVARNVLREERRHDERQAATTHALALAAESYYEQATPEDSALMTAVSQLSPLDQEIFLMLSADGLPPREVAKIFGLSPNAVSIRGHRARTKLRSLLAEDQADDEPPLPDAAPITTGHAP
jgi:RNA polymerase sigma-70 factor, ECF subfamily